MPRTFILFSLWLALLFKSSNPLAQSQVNPIYETQWGKDGVITATGIAMALTGSYLITQKAPLTEADLVNIDKSQVNRFDRFAAGNFSANAKKLSDIPFYTSFGLPLLLLTGEEAVPHAPQIYFMYAEAISLTGGLYALTAGLANRKRPNVYATHAPLEERLHKFGNNSFFGGHTAATATATFFTAKIFHDLYPDSKWKPVVWGAAAAVPVGVGYLRLKAGKHFLSDNIVGYAVGAGIGILVPQLHKKDSSIGWKLIPSLDVAAGENLQGLALTRSF